MAASTSVGGLPGFSTQNTIGIVDNNVEDILNPAVTGYFYLVWTRKPNIPGVSAEAIADITRVLVNKVTLPGITLGKAETVNGFAGTSKVTAPTTVDYSRETTIGINEQMGMLALKSFENWVFAIRDPHTGLSRIVPYTMRNISGDLMIIVAKPVRPTDTPIEGQETVGDDYYVEKAFHFRHIYPTGVPYDIISPSKESSDKIQYDVPFAFREMAANEKTQAWAGKEIAKLLKVSSWDAYDPTSQ